MIFHDKNIEDDFCQVRGLGARVPTKLVLDASPYVLPLAKFNDDYESFILVLIDGQRSEIHVIENAEEIRVILADETSFTAKVLGQDKKTDIAVLKIDPGETKPLKRRRSHH